ncbi:hypothetical protein ACLOJK_017614 [Asimina triloba]
MKEGNPNGGQVEIDLELLSNCMRKRLDKYPCSDSPDPSGQPSIHRVPEHLCQGEDKSAYEPKIISVGPYYHGEPRLQAMEDHKWLSLRSFLDRNTAVTLPQYLREMKALEARARSYYCEETTKLQQPHEFFQMMLLDGCFIVELFLKRTREKNELIYSTRWMLPLITNDLLLLENQLPFFVLQKLFELAELQKLQECGFPSSVICLAIHFFGHLLPGKVDNPPRTEDVHHLLHLLHFFHSRRLVGHPTTSSLSSSHGSGSPPESSSHSIMGKAQPQQLQVFDLDTKGTAANISKWKSVKVLLQFLSPAASRGRSTKAGSPPPQKSIPGAVELHDAGAKFKVKRGANSYLEVTFHNGVMEIPYLLIKDSTSTLFRNLIAFEQCHPDSDCHFTSYAFFVDCIVNTPADVALLGQHKIIEHWLGEDEAVALLFNSLCKGVAIDTQTRHYFPMLFQEVRKYCETDWHTWRARLVHDYFSNPWAIISVAAAVVLLLLTVAQTVFAVLEFTQPP